MFRAASLRLSKLLCPSALAARPFRPCLRRVTDSFASNSNTYYATPLPGILEFNRTSQYIYVYIKRNTCVIGKRKRYFRGKRKKKGRDFFAKMSLLVTDGGEEEKRKGRARLHVKIIDDSARGGPLKRRKRNRSVQWHLLTIC